MPDINTMTLDELTAHKAQIKGKMDALREEAKAASAVQAKVILKQHADEARKQMQIWADANGKTLDEAADYWMGRLTENGDPGRWIQAKLVKGMEGKIRPALPTADAAERFIQGQGG